MTDRPCICVDIDNVLLNVTTPFVEWWNRRQPLVPGRILLSENEIYEEVEEFMKTRPILPLMDSQIPNYLKRLRRRFNIHLLTTCNKQWTADCMRNLCGIEYDTIHLGLSNDRKIEAIHQLQPVAIIEDDPRVIERLLGSKEGAGIPVFAPRVWKYVQGLTDHPCLHRYKKWAEIENKCVNLSR